MKYLTDRQLARLEKKTLKAWMKMARWSIEKANERYLESLLEIEDERVRRRRIYNAQAAQRFKEYKWSLDGMF